MSRADRTILLIAGASFLLLTIAVILSTPASEEEEASPIPSSYAATPGGARAAYLLLQRLGISVQRWEEPPLTFANRGPGVTLVIAQPIINPSHAERSALRSFLENGGRVLFCGGNRPAFFPWIKLDKLPSNAAGAAVIGRGELIWWENAKPLTNTGLQRDGNLALFLNSVGFQTRKAAYWDEYFHGERGSLWDYIGRVAAVRWAAVPLCVILLTALLTFSRRSGPIMTPIRVSRLSPLEFVESLGALYRKAGAGALAVDVTARELRMQLLRRLVLPANASDQQLARAAAIRLGFNEAELLDIFERTRAATQNTRSLSHAQALAMVQSLQRFTALLKAPTPKRIH
jgi:hypothetical protein